MMIEQLNTSYAHCIRILAVSATCYFNLTAIYPNAEYVIWMCSQHSVLAYLMAGTGLFHLKYILLSASPPPLTGLTPKDFSVCP